ITSERPMVACSSGAPTVLTGLKFTLAEVWGFCDESGGWSMWLRPSLCAPAELISRVWQAELGLWAKLNIAWERPWEQVTEGQFRVVKMGNLQKNQSEETRKPHE